jgi:hypothetical protein
MVGVFGAFGVFAFGVLTVPPVTGTLIVTGAGVLA